MKQLLYLIVLLALSLPGQTRTSIDLHQKHVLLLYSYHSDFPTSTLVLNGIRQAFANNQPSIDIEYMDSKRLNDPTSQQLLLQLLQYKLSQRFRYDLVITVDDNATLFAATHRASLFPDSPLVYLGVNNELTTDTVGSQPWATGVMEIPAYLKTLQLVSSLIPQRKTVHIITDQRISDIGPLQINNNQDSSGLKLKSLSLQQNSWDELAERLTRLGDSDMVALVTAFIDKNNKQKSFSDSLAFINKHTSVPILHFWQHGMGEGVIGGHILDHQDQGRQAGLMALRILNGESPEDIPVLRPTEHPLKFDYRQLQKFDIGRNQLADNAEILFKPVTLWHSYWKLILSVGIVFSSLALLTAYLLRRNYIMRHMSNRLAEQKSFLRLLMETLPDLVWIKDPQGVYLACNKRFEEFFGATAKEIYGKTDYDFVDKELADFFRGKDLVAIQANGQSINEEEVQYACDGHKELLETIKTPVYDTRNGKLLGVLGVGRDITGRKANEESLRLLASVVENTAEGVLITDTDHKIIEVNQSFLDITGYQRDEVLGKNPRLLKSGLHDVSFYDSVWHDINNAGSWTGEFHNRRKNGVIFPSWQTISEVRDADGRLTHYVSVFSDISQLKKSQQRISHLAYHDALTDLPNRMLLKERLDQAIKHAHRDDAVFTLMFLDLDNFKHINDSLGHSEGDHLLEIAAHYLQEILREKDTVARVGGDEFVLLFDDLDDADQAATLAQKILSTLQQPIHLKNNTVNISASLGICLYPQDGEDADTLLRNADSAMYRAKKRGRNTYDFYTEELTRHAEERMRIEHDLRYAISHEELILYYQPQLDASSQKIIGAEALIRWNHPKLGMIPPDRFIPVAEESGLILPIGEWVLEQAAKQARQWLDNNIYIGKIAVNIAGQQITKGHLSNKVKQLLSYYQLTPNHLAIEVTETFIMSHEESSIRHLKQLYDQGVEVAIDDFGTGYSSLSYLKKLPIHKLKIDKSFIRDIPQDKDDMAICRTIIALAESLNLRVIAEGVETEDQALYLKQQGCHEFQGYLFSKPLPAEELEALYYQYT